jgi:hypothetical protein
MRGEALTIDLASIASLTPAEASATAVPHGPAQRVVRERDHLLATHEDEREDPKEKASTHRKRRAP